MKTRLFGFAALVALLGVVAGVPWLLLRWGADLTPDQISATALLDVLLRPDDGTIALAAVTVIAWIAWAVIGISVAVELVAVLRGVTAPRLPGFGWPQWGAHQLVAAAALLFATASLASSGGPAATSLAAAAPLTVPSGSHAGRPAVADDPGPILAASGNRGAARTHVVRTGDSLWGLAERYLGDGKRYRELARLNADLLDGQPGLLHPGMELQIPDTGDHTGQRTVTVRRGDTLSGIADRELGDPARYDDIARASRHLTQPDGQRLTDPDVIDIGWKLRIPADDREGEPARVRRPADSPPDRRSGGDQRDRPRPKTDPSPRTASPAPSSSTPSSSTPSPSTPSPSTPSPSTPSARPASAAPTVPAASAPAEQDAQTVDTGWVTPSWLLTGLTGGGAMLAGGLLIALRRRRRSQWRSRKPGLMVAAPSIGLAPVEKTIVAAGDLATPTVEFVDDVLRRLAAARAASPAPMPHLVSVEVSAAGLTLHLAEPCDLGPAWQSKPGQRTWTVSSTVDRDSVGPAAEYQPPPWPLLVTIGSDHDGGVWMLNLEQAGVIHLTGDPVFVHDFARYLAAELACNLWSQHVLLDCVGLADEVAPMARERIFTHPPQTLPDVAADAADDAATTVGYADDEGLDLPTARAHQAGPEAWPAHALLVDLGAGPEDHSALDHLVRVVAERPGYCGTTVVVSGGEPTPSDGLVLHLSSDGRLRVPTLDLDLAGVGLTVDEAVGCAALLAQADDVTPDPMPRRADGDGWRKYADEAGNLCTEHAEPRRAASLPPGVTVPADSPADPETPDAHERAATADSAPPAAQTPPDPVPGAQLPAVREPDQDDANAANSPVTGPISASLLPEPDDVYTMVAAATAEDLAVLAPPVPPAIRTAVEDADPELDADLAAWFSPECDLPRLTLLGPVQVRAHGRAIAKRKAYYTELVAYLATRAHGATEDEVADAFSIKPTRAREVMGTVRSWLGPNPRTGTLHLPHARESAAAKRRGVGVYEIDGLLVDADLFRRLRVRGQARGSDGIADLRRALTLVTGQPLDQLRATGWTWMYGSNRLDQHLRCAVVDVAHIVTTHSLNTGELTLAREAVETGLRADPHDEVSRLDLGAVLTAEGHLDQAREVIDREVCNRTDDDGPPIDLSARTLQVLAHHGDWLKHRREAS